MLPNIVGNIRVDQAWGLFQISAAAHEVSGSYNNLSAGALPTTSLKSAATPKPSGRCGMAALQIKNIPTGAGDDIKIDASWAKGDTKNVIATDATSPSFVMFGGSGRLGAYQSVGFGATTDAVYLPVFAGGDGSLHLTTAYGVPWCVSTTTGIRTVVQPVRQLLRVRYDGTAKAMACTNYIGTRTVA